MQAGLKMECLHVQHIPYNISWRQRDGCFSDVQAEHLLTGLDARAAAIVIRSVKNTSRSGRTVIVTIHQPSLEIFEAFDALVLLQKGGKVRSGLPAVFMQWTSSAGMLRFCLDSQCQQVCDPLS